jgi:predicted PurR-regulated permease PerM
MTLNINIETKNIFKILTLVAAFTLGILAISRTWSAIMLVLVAFFLALALNPAVSFFARHLPGKRRGPAIAIVYVLAISVVVLLVSSIASPVIKETSSFAKTLPNTVNNLRYRNPRIKGLIDKYQLSDNIDSTVASLKHRAGQVGTSAVSSVGTVTNSVVKTLAVTVMSILMLTGGQRLLKRLADKVYLNKELRDRHELLAGKMYRVVTGYVNGQVIVALIASMFSVGALSLLRVPYPLPLAGIVFLFGLIPLVGNTIAATLVILSAIIFKDVTAGAILLAYFILYQQIENATLQPVIQGRTTQLPPLIIFVSVILGVALLGPIGGLFAIPAAGCAKILLADYLDHRDAVKVGDSPKTLVEKVKHKVARAVS